MKIVLFCENKYAIDILTPIQEEGQKDSENQILWYVHKKKIPDFPLKDAVKYTNSIQEIYDFKPDAIFCPGNIVPYYLSGVKIQIFHGYAAEKKDHWVIRRYFDTYFTQGPFFTAGFEKLAKKYKDFEVLETGWPRQDWIFQHKNDFETQKQELLKKYGKKELVLYAPTFSPSLTSLPKFKDGLKDFVNRQDVLLILKFHPLTKKEWIDEYRQLASEQKNMLWIEDYTVTKYMLMADAMISDTSSTIYEFLLLDKPVITLDAVAKDIYWKNITDPMKLSEAYDEIKTEPKLSELRKWIIKNYDPYTDGNVAKRMLEGAKDYIKRHGVPEKRKLNLWRKYTSIKTFGRITKNKN